MDAGSEASGGPGPFSGRLCRGVWRAGVAGALTGLLAAAGGCAGLAGMRSTASVGPGVEPVTYELSGPTLAGLETEAARLCPAGYDVARRWQRSQQAGLGAVDRWLGAVGDWTGLSGRAAQMVVTCRAAAEPAASDS